MATNTKVVSVTDGDTFKGTGSTIYRLEGVNTPERGQAGYTAAKDYLTKLIGGEIVSVTVKAKDVYGRYVVQVRQDNRNINDLVKQKFG